MHSVLFDTYDQYFKDLLQGLTKLFATQMIQMKKLQEKVDAYEHQHGQVFSISYADQNKINDLTSQHALNEHQINDIPTDMFSYIFIPTEQGIVCQLKCNKCGAIFDIYK